MVLEETLRQGSPGEDALGMILAMGPAFCSELVLFDWSPEPVVPQCAEGSEVDYASLQEKRIVSKSKYQLKKVVGSDGDFTAKSLTVKAHAFTASAKAAIEGNGGTCVVLPKTAPAEKAE